MDASMCEEHGVSWVVKPENSCLGCVISWISNELSAFYESGTIGSQEYEDSKGMIKREFQKRFPDSGVEITEDSDEKYLEIHLTTHPGTNDFPVIEELKDMWDKEMN